MPADTVQRVHRLLARLPKQGVAALKELVCNELNYEHRDSPLSTRNWPDSVRPLLAEDPRLLARAGSDVNPFDVIYCRLSPGNGGRAFPLSLMAERQVVNQFLKDHRYALFVFSDHGHKYWHFVNVRPDKDARRRKVLRRIAVGPHEKLRTAAERIALLDARPSREDRFVVSPLAVQRSHDDAFNVEQVTKEFYRQYRRVFKELQTDLERQTGDAAWAHDYALQFLNRVMFLYFVQRKRWMGDNPDFLADFWKAYRRSKAAKDTFAADWLSVLFFEAFNDKFNPGRADRRHFPADIFNALAAAPFLNGGLFERNRLDREYTPCISDMLFEAVFAFFEAYNFTISEDTPLDQEVAVDPEMIGKVYENLVNVAEVEGKEDDQGVHYTPPVEIDLMCRLALVDWLVNHLGAERRRLLTQAVFAFEPQEKEDADGKVAGENLWPELERLLREVTVVDPACGSGSFLVGMLYVLDDLLARSANQLGTQETPYERKKHIIDQSLYGVDVMDWAVQIAELRLWLQLVIDTDLEPAELKFRPLLPNLSFKLRPGDSIVQEAGGINLAMRKGSGDIPSLLKGQITRLQAEKRKFYNNDRSCRYRSDEQVKREELRLFRDILDDRVKRVADQLKEVEGALRPQTNLFGEAQRRQTEAERQDLECRRDLLVAEREQAVKARDALRTARDVPFAWDIAFVEVFEGDSKGFDIVIGNPPYVRQESIRDLRQPATEVTVADKKAYKARLARSVYTRWPRSFGYDWTTNRAKWSLDGKSDLYIYFYLHGLSLLNDKGAFCFITSNSWLDVGYGKDLQQFLLTRGWVHLVVDNQVRRSFESADVNTVIVLLGAGQDTPSPRKASLDRTARFVMLTAPFEDTLSPVIWEEVEDATVRRSTPEFRVHPLLQSEAVANGIEPKTGTYGGDKWGGKYLRAPDIYWTILQKGGDKLVRLGDIAEVRPGCYAGINDFFYLTRASATEWGIEAECLRPIIRSPRVLTAVRVRVAELAHLVFFCPFEKAELKRRGLAAALEYIRWGEHQVTRQRQKTAAGIPWPQTESVRHRRPGWWAMPAQSVAPVSNFLPYVLGERFLAPWSDMPVATDRCFHRLAAAAVGVLPLAAVLNSTLAFLFVSLLGRSNLGLGAEKYETKDARGLLVLRPTALGAPGETGAILSRMGSRTPLPLRKELDAMDRRALDLLVFDSIALTQGEREAVYAAVLESVEARLKKAGSLGKRGQEGDE